MKQTNEIHITKQQLKIITYLYQFRFLTRYQIQQLLNHKNHKKILIWINNLIDNGYVRKVGIKTFAVEAPLYYLGTTSRTYFKKHSEIETVNPRLLDRIWREKSLSQSFKDRCRLNADIYLSLLKLAETGKATLHYYSNTDLQDTDYVLKPYPDAYIAIEESKDEISRYFLDIFSDLPARMMLRKRVRQYLNYYDSDLWQNTTKHPFPSIIFICPDERSKHYLHSYILKMLEQAPELHWFLTTKNATLAKGMCNEILENVVQKEE